MNLTNDQQNLKSTVERLAHFQSELMRAGNCENEVALGISRFGIGVIALRKFSRGEHILNFEGTRLTFDQAVALGDLQCYAMQMTESTYIDLGSPGRFVNHSCSPNAGVSGKRLVAITAIMAGEEIFFDYSTTMDEDFWQMQCRCESADCRHVIGDFKSLKQDTRDRYIEIGVVPSFAMIAAQRADLRRNVS